jgi:hypothetical protein
MTKPKLTLGDIKMSYPKSAVKISAKDSCKIKLDGIAYRYRHDARGRNNLTLPIKEWPQLAEFTANLNRLIGNWDGNNEDVVEFLFEYMRTNFGLEEEM